MDLNALNNIPYFLTRWYDRVNEFPEKVLLVDGKTNEKLTINDVEYLSGCIYSYLKLNNVSADDFVMIDMPRGIHMVPCMLGVWKAGAAFTAVEDDYAPDRIAYIRRDVGCKVFLDEALYKEIICGEYEKGFVEADNHAASFAVYTSGTTGFPKGVLHEYGNIKINSLSSRVKTGRRVTSESRYAQISPFNFVASIKIVLSLIQLGFTMYVIPYEIVKNPLKLKQYYLDNEISVSFLSPSILRIIGKDLGPHMKYVFTGSEPANGLSLEGICLVNTYSMSEGAFTLTQFIIDEPYDICPVGKPNNDELKLYILDENGNELPNGSVGEIAFENPFMRGYINLPEETENVMRGGLYHTGDLGKKLADGNLVLVGRANDMIKINGNRIEPAEIEKAFKEASGVSWCCAKGFEEPNRSFICLYFTDDLRFDEKEMKEKLGKKLPYYMIPSYFVHIDEIPLLPNGKINKKVLSAPNKEVYTVEYAAPESEIEVLLCDCIAKVLKREKVGIDDDFYQLGGDSLATMALLAEADLDDLTAADIFNGCCVRNIARIYSDKVASRKGVSPEEYEMNARKNTFTPLAIQTSFIDVQLNSPKHPVFNIPACYRFDDVTIAPKVADALNKVIKSSPVFSTVFCYNEKCELVEKYVEGVFEKVTVQNVTEEQFADIKRDFLSYFKKILNKPLCRCGVYVTEKSGYMLVLFHHGVIDGMGVQVFLKRFAAAFNGEDLPLDTFYTCLAREVEIKNSEEYRKAELYMTQIYGGSDWSVNLDSDKNSGNNEMGIYPCPISFTREQMDSFEKRTAVTRNQLFEAVLLLAMARCNSKRKVMMSMAFHNRVDQATKNALGVILRKVPAALNLDNYSSADEMFKSLQQQSVNTIRYCIYEWVIPHESPVVNDYITMAYETSEITDGGSMRKIGLKAYPCMTDDTYAPVRMFLQVMDTPKGINPLLGYSKQFYSDERIEQFASAIAEISQKLLFAEDLRSISIDELYG